MACLYRYLIALAIWLGLTSSAAADLFTSPQLRLDPGMHTAPIRRADVDAAGRYLVTASEDKTLRVWSVAEGRLLDTIPLPLGEGNIGEARATAISPDGSLIAVGGWLGHNPEQPHSAYIFDRAERRLIKRIEGLPNVVLYRAFSPNRERLVATLWG